ncbi:Os06g0147250 [Oryza sativa Japonica Group]|jgi:hypothetical protein|uniref:Os06g0147250 protein n=1 Tax=Oryza sativa subsp. japonica TaxID=39947 RepID=C7J3H0_ORYSJ|nr:Os06g0147250 [Oryza sativa Japonica Group]|eukprot:NP_001174598.1 Os06g0147250 [Oryza sativa Japonica Group]
MAGLRMVWLLDAQLATSHLQVARRYRRHSLRRHVVPQPPAAVLVLAAIREGAGELTGEISLQGRRLVLLVSPHGCLLMASFSVDAVACGSRRLVDGCVHGGWRILHTVPLVWSAVDGRIYISRQIKLPNGV